MAQENFKRTLFAAAVVVAGVISLLTMGCTQTSKIGRIHLFVLYF